MERHHETALMAAFDQLYLEGGVSIPKDRLYLWFDQERLTKAVYREIVKPLGGFVYSDLPLGRCTGVVCSALGHADAEPSEGGV